MTTFNNDLLCTFGQESLYPLLDVVRNAIMPEFLNKKMVWHLIKGLREIKGYHITLFLLFDIIYNISDCVN